MYEEMYEPASANANDNDKHILKYIVLLSYKISAKSIKNAGHFPTKDSTFACEEPTKRR